MLVACCSSSYFYLAIPISLNSLDREGVRLLSPCGSQILQLQMQVQVIPLQVTSMSSSGSSTKTLNDTMFPFPMISSGAQLGVIGTVSLLGFFFYLGSVVGPSLYLYDVMLYSCIV